MTPKGLTSTAKFEISDRYDGDPDEYPYAITGEILAAGTNPDGSLYYRVQDSVYDKVWVIRLDWESDGE